MAADVLPDLPFVAAKWQKPGRQGKAPRLIVLHSTESPESSKGAENVARYFTTAERPGSSHVVVDNDSTVRCVHDADTAYGAAGANNDGLHVEQVGYAKQSGAEWQDAYDLDLFDEAGKIIRAWSDQYDIPLRWLTVAQVADGVTKGLCTHGDVSAAFPKVSTGHTDPGPNYPKAKALAIWQGNQEDEMRPMLIERELPADGTVHNVALPPWWREDYGFSGAYLSVVTDGNTKPLDVRAAAYSDTKVLDVVDKLSGGRLASHQLPEGTRGVSLVNRGDTPVGVLIELLP